MFYIRFNRFISILTSAISHAEIYFPKHTESIRHFSFISFPKYSTFVFYHPAEAKYKFHSAEHLYIVSLTAAKPFSPTEHMKHSFYRPQTKRFVFPRKVLCVPSYTKRANKYALMSWFLILEQNGKYSLFYMGKMGTFYPYLPATHTLSPIHISSINIRI